MSVPAIWVWLFWAAATVLLGRFELRSDDAGVIAALVLVATFVLGCLHPRRAWQWSLLTGPAVPAADLLFRRPAAAPNLSTLAVFGFVVALGLAGSLTGAFVRRNVGSHGRDAGPRGA